MSRRWVLLALAFFSFLSVTARPAADPPSVATFSIVALDEQTGELGVAVESRFFSVGSVVPWAKAGVGAIATQAFANTTFGPKGLKLLEQGLPAQEVLDLLVKGDPQADQRQVGILDAKGRAATWTGEKCNPWAGGRTGKGYAAQGNILTGKEVVDALASTFEATAGLPLADRLVKALAAAQAAGGDSRGQQSAALLVVRDKGGYAGYNDRYIDLRVEDHPRPIEELQRLLEIHHDTNAFADARMFLEKGNRERGVKIMEEATRRRIAKAGTSGADQGGALYDLACFYSIAGMPEPALANLEKAFRLDATLIPFSRNDPDLEPIRKDARYKELVQDAAAPKK